MHQTTVRLEQVPLRLQGIEGSIGLGDGQPLVDQVKQLGVVLLHRDGDILLGEGGADDGELALVTGVLEHEVAGDERVTDRRLDVSVDQIFDSQADVIVGTADDGVVIEGEVAGGADLYTDARAAQVGDGVVLGTVGGADDDDLTGLEDRGGEAIVSFRSSVTVTPLATPS